MKYIINQGRWDRDNNFSAGFQQIVTGLYQLGLGYAWDVLENCQHANDIPFAILGFNGWEKAGEDGERRGVKGFS